MTLVPPYLPRSSYVPSSFGLYCSACFVSLFVSILCTCCSHFFWYCFISFAMFCVPDFCLMHWFFSFSSFLIPSKCLKNFIYAASERCSSLFFSTQASIPNFNAALAVMLWIVNFVSLFICFPKCLRIAPFILLYINRKIRKLKMYCMWGSDSGDSEDYCRIRYHILYSDIIFLKFRKKNRLSCILEKKAISFLRKSVKSYHARH